MRRACCCDGDCTGCVRVINPCTGLPQVGSLVELFEPGTATLVGSGVSDSAGDVCGLPGSTPVDIRITKTGLEPVAYAGQVIPCNGVLSRNQRSGGRVRLHGMTCNSSAGRVPTTWTVSRSGFPTQTVTTDAGTGYVDIWLPATGVWNRACSADDFVAESGTFNFTNACSNQDVFPNFGTGTPVATHFCGCSGFAMSPKPYRKMATITDGGGSSSVDISPNANWCGTSFVCVVRDLGDATLAPAMPGTACFNFGRVSCGTLPYDDANTRPVRVGVSIFAARTGGLPDGGQTSPQTSMTWNANCVVNPPNTLQQCNPPNTRSRTWRDARWNCGHMVEGTAWSPTSYTIHSHAPPVVELHFDQAPDFAERAGSTPPPGGPPFASIILSVEP